MSKYIDAEEITPIMAEYVANVFSRKEHLDNISYGYCMEIADVFRRYAERAKQEQPAKRGYKDCNGCEHNRILKDQIGWQFRGCFGGNYNGKPIAEIEVCPLKTAVQQEQPEVDLEKFISDFFDKKDAENNGRWSEDDIVEAMTQAFELGRNARKENKD